MSDSTQVIPLRIGSRRYQIATSGEYLRQTRKGLKHRINNRLRALIGRNAFEPRMTALFNTLVAPGATVLDIGANIGCTALLFSEMAAQVFAFEPVAATFALLQRNVQAAGRRNIGLLPYALGDENKYTQMLVAEENLAMSFILDRTERDDHASANIAVKRLDDVFAGLGAKTLDFIKIDVEGYELRVLKGAARTIAEHRPVVEMEFNAWCLDVQQRITLPDFLDAVTAMFPLVFAVDHGTFLNVNTTKGRYEAMAQNILHKRFKELVCAFEPTQLQRFMANYRDGTPR